MYAYNLKGGKRFWTYGTYEERPYETFGAVNTQPIIYKDMLILGGRNPELQVLNKKTGQKIWRYTKKEGGWISGDPLVVGDRLYRGIR
jgi:outer membrane protein assembly factor BamB